MIEVINLSKSYGSKTVLKHINVIFEPGKVYGIVGENGSGKTSFFRCMAEMEDYEGKIKTGYKEIKNHLGFLTAEPYFLPKITGEEHIYLMADARKIKLKNLQEKNIFKLPLKEYISQYSTGMKKKLAIMAVLFQQNDFIILDEPFNGIDLESSIILEEIIKMLKNKGKIILISSHIFSTLKNSCDVIYQIENGQFSNPYSPSTFGDLEDAMKSKILQNHFNNFSL